MDLFVQVYNGFAFRMEWISINWAIVQLIFTGKLNFVILFSTFFTYLNLLSMRELNKQRLPFIYLQPLFADFCN
jgi:hypothetical protein